MKHGLEEQSAVTVWNRFPVTLKVPLLDQVIANPREFSFIPDLCFPTGGPRVYCPVLAVIYTLLPSTSAA